MFSTLRCPSENHFTEGAGCFFFYVAPGLMRSLSTCRIEGSMIGQEQVSCWRTHGWEGRVVRRNYLRCESHQMMNLVNHSFYTRRPEFIILWRTLMNIDLNPNFFLSITSICYLVHCFKKNIYSITKQCLRNAISLSVQSCLYMVSGTDEKLTTLEYM